jgi:WD40 repeat protein
MNGLFCEWDATTRERRSIYLAHPRPVSGITFSPDHKRLATSSWDGTIILAKIGKDRDRATLAGHKDIVTGCRFLPDNQSVLSWSHDGTMKLWEIKRAKQTASWQAHKDRVTAGDVSPDGRWFFSGSRDGHVVLWDARTQEEAASSTHERNEVVWCGFLPNAELVAYALSKGEVYYKSVPDLQTRRRHDFGEAILCAALPRSGQQLAVGTSDGRILFLAHDDLLEGALCVTPTESHESRPNFFDRLLGRKAVQRVLRCCCPICHRVFEISEPDKQTAVCPDCKRRLHLNEFTLPA